VYHKIKILVYCLALFAVKSMVETTKKKAKRLLTWLDGEKLAVWLEMSEAKQSQDNRSYGPNAS